MSVTMMLKAQGFARIPRAAVRAITAAMAKVETDYEVTYSLWYSEPEHRWYAYVDADDPDPTFGYPEIDRSMAALRAIVPAKFHEYI